MTRMRDFEHGKAYETHVRHNLLTLSALSISLFLERHAGQG
jgi:hypothetical protein